jgi:ion channel-forming bestrophin family protein
MLVKRNLDPVKVVEYVWRPLTYAVAVATAVLILRLARPQDAWLVLPFAPVGALAAALAIVIAFRANTAYQRWWEARTMWQGVVASSRVLGRQLVAATGDAITACKGGAPDDVLRYRREVLLTVVAFAHALRHRLRGTDATADLRRLLPAAESARIAGAENIPNMILTRLGVLLKDGVRHERVGAFDPIAIEPNLTALHTWAGGAERIKDTPIPRQYSFFSRVFIAVLVTLLPFGLVDLLDGVAIWWLVPLSTVGGGLFILLERTSEVIDSPFTNSTTDVPMTALCMTIERDLREQLGEAELPPAPVPVAGYLW